jgi:hypothetical protein
VCCQETRMLNLPPEAIEALAHYRKLRDRRGWDWGEEGLPDFFRWARFSLLGPVFDAVAETRDNHFADLVVVLEGARSFYRRVAETADQ